MKRKEAIKQIQEGKIQVCNDLLPSTKEIKKFLKEAFPEDNYLDIRTDYTNEYLKNRYFEGVQNNRWYSLNAEIKNKKIINLSTITKRKKTKLKQLEKQFSDLAKDVVELKKELLFTSVSCRNCEVVDAEEIQQETIKEEEINWSVPQRLISIVKEHSLVVVNTGINDEECFQGLVIKENGIHNADFIGNWAKDDFKKFKGELTMKN